MQKENESNRWFIWFGVVFVALVVLVVWYMASTPVPVAPQEPDTSAEATTTTPMNTGTTTQASSTDQ